jgi:type I restriction enzyme R subunit
VNKKDLSERDICSKFMTPALIAAKWDLMTQIREEVSFTKGRVIVRGRLSTRGDPKRSHAPEPNRPLHLLRFRVSVASC